jgi:ornithine--oxo-acid transaminase
MMPVSAVLTSSEVMLTIRPGEHGSTFGGNPLGCRVAMEAVQIILDEKLSERAAKLGELFRDELKKINHPAIKEIRGMGLLNAVEFYPGGIDAQEFCEAMMKAGLLAKPTRKTTIRFAPPLVIDESQLRNGIAIIKDLLAKR